MCGMFILILFRNTSDERVITDRWCAVQHVAGLLVLSKVHIFQKIDKAPGVIVWFIVHMLVKITSN